MGRHHRSHSRSHRHRSRSSSSESPRRSRSRSREASFPRAVITESGGEISCSVEETNRIRAELGLAPLEEDHHEMKVQKNGDEISMSVEETNALRKKLGLPPLEVDSEESETRLENGVIFVDMAKKRREEEIREKLEKSRQERERIEMQNLKGKGLGDMLMEEEKSMDVKEWVHSKYDG